MTYHSLLINRYISRKILLKIKLFQTLFAVLYLSGVIDASLILFIEIKLLKVYILMTQIDLHKSDLEQIL